MPRHKNPQLAAYRAKRDPGRTPEPFGRIHIPPTGQLFVVQQHNARHLHFDLRLEMNGVLKSWAVPKGPSDDPSDKRFAVETEDHPLDYADFEGHIPAGNYGAGYVIVWDRGRYRAVEDFEAGYAKGKLLFELYGSKLHGRWTLVRLKSKTSTGKEWLLIKEQDSHAQADGASFQDTSVLSGLTVQQLAKPAAKQGALKRSAGRLERARQQTIDEVDTRPMLASPGTASNRKGWVWELKYDGYRIIARKDGGEISLITRNGHEVTERFPEIAQVVSHLPAGRLVIDGELVVNDASGRPSFALMQQRARLSAQHQISTSAITQPARYYCFDLLHLAGQTLTHCDLVDRKKVLRALLPPQSALVYSEHVADRGVATFAAAREMGIEGVVGKRARSPYRSGRSSDWIKVRNQRTDDFVIVGWSASRGSDQDIGSLALAEYRDGELTYVGHAGSGLNGPLRGYLRKALSKLARKTSPIKPAPETKKPTHWVRANLVAEVAYTEYTPYGHLRHPSVQRLRDDKKAEECTGQFDGVAGAGIKTAAPTAVSVTNPDKIFFPEAGFTKADLVGYYRKIAPWMLPYLEDRPLVLTRFPDGIHGKSFFQRDIPDYVPDWIRREVLWSESTEREIHYVIAAAAEDLAYLANMGTIPIHMWHSRVSALERPDWCVLDLDPKDAPFTDVITLAKAIADICDAIDLPAYPKTSGKSGMHVLMPLSGQLSHDQSRTLAELIATLVVRRHPEIATIARSVRARGGKVYVDFGQNGHGRLIVAPFAVRAEPAASVSMPLRWSEVNGRLKNENYHIGNALARLRRMGKDPMREVLTEAPDLARSLALLSKLLD